MWGKSGGDVERNFSGFCMEQSRMTVKHAANGEFMAASWLLEELGLAAGPYDVQMLAQVIAYAARDSGADVEAVSKTLLVCARADEARGETINVFYFKDRKFAKEMRFGARTGTAPLTAERQARYDKAAHEADEATDRWLESNAQHDRAGGR